MKVAQASTTATSGLAESAEKIKCPIADGMMEMIIISERASKRFGG
jgi:hypothetical protein